VNTPERAVPSTPTPLSGISRIGMIVPSSNTTMETELPELFRRQSRATGHQYTFHSARAALKNVTPRELAVMAGKAAECAVSVSDANVDVIAYACLVAVMAQGPGAHERAETVIAEAARDNGHPARVTSSAGALVRTLTGIGARTVAMVTPYTPELTTLVSDYIRGAGIDVLEVVSLGVADNLEVGRLDPEGLLEISRGLGRDGVDAVVLSACVQMPSLSAIERVEAELGVPVQTAATATAYEILTLLGHQPAIFGAGRLLDGTRRRDETLSHA
jgi:maleate isomerase